MQINISSATHSFEHAYPARSTIRNVHDEQLVLRAVEAYRFFYPSVSMEAVFAGTRALGIADGKGMAVMAVGPRHVAMTANSDTPYVSGVVDLMAMGPTVIELPPGPLVGVVNDHHQRWVADVGMSGPDAGNGGRHLVLPPGYEGVVPDGYHVGRAETHKVFVAIRALPTGGGVRSAKQLARTVKVYPLAEPGHVLPIVDITERALDASLIRWETSMEYWRRLHAVIDLEPVVEEYRPMYGALAALGIAKGWPFAMDERMRGILEAAARLANDEMRVAAFASERADRIVWSDRVWEWAGLVPDDANFETASFLDLEARDRWFFQAILTSPAMFRRSVGAGSLYWLAARDSAGAYLDGGRSYRLTLPQPVPASMFWSVTAYDATTRSQIVAPQDRAVRGSLADRLEPNAAGEIEVYFGPSAPPNRADHWIQTVPGAGFFLYLRIYGPQAAAFDGSWRPSDVTSLEPARAVASVPAAITTPSRVESRIGSLEFPLGAPTRETAARIYEHLDAMHAMEAFMNSFQAVSLYALRSGLHDVGVEDNDVIVFSGLMDCQSLFLTANCDTVYFISVLDLWDGPIVLEVPPGVLGVVDDMWFRWVVDVGIPGPDRGEGGRYLFVPQGYRGPLPESGYVITRPSTMRLLLLGRAFLEDDDPAPAAARIRSGVKIYRYVPGGVGNTVAAFLDGKGPFGPLREPPRTRFVEGTGMAINTIPPNDLSYFDMLHAAVQLEPASALDPELAGQFAAIGIIKDKPFRPDARMKKILADAVVLANAAARTVALRPRAPEGFYYGQESAWTNAMFIGGSTFSEPPPLITANGIVRLPDPHARALEARTAMFYVATGITPAMAMRMSGVGSQYLGAFVDAKGLALDGANTYRLVLPPNVPAKLFWSITLYDNTTRSMLQTPQRFPRAGSQSYPTPAAITDEEGVTVLYFAPICPPGVARGNWIQTVPGVGYFVMLRLYGPQPPFFDRSWRPSEVERR